MFIINIMVYNYLACYQIFFLCKGNWEIINRYDFRYRRAVKKYFMLHFVRNRIESNFSFLLSISISMTIHKALRKSVKKNHSMPLDIFPLRGWIKYKFVNISNYDYETLTYIRSDTEKFVFSAPKHIHVDIISLYESCVCAKK